MSNHDLTLKTIAARDLSHQSSIGALNYSDRALAFLAWNNECMPVVSEQQFFTLDEFN